MEIQSPLEKKIMERTMKKCRKIQVEKDEHLRIVQQTLDMVLKLENCAAKANSETKKLKFWKMVHRQLLKARQSTDKLVKLSEELVQILTDAGTKLDRIKTLKPRLPVSADTVVTGSTSETGTTTAPGGEDEGDMDVSDPGSTVEPEM